MLLKLFHLAELFSDFVWWQRLTNSALNLRQMGTTFFLKQTVWCHFFEYFLHLTFWLLCTGSAWLPWMPWVEYLGSSSQTCVTPPFSELLNRENRQFVDLFWDERFGTWKVVDITSGNLRSEEALAGIDLVVADLWVSKISRRWELSFRPCLASIFVQPQDGEHGLEKLETTEIYRHFSIITMFTYIFSFSQWFIGGWSLCHFSGKSFRGFNGNGKAPVRRNEPIRLRCPTWSIPLQQAH